MVKRKGGGFKKQALHLSEFLGDAAPVAPIAPPTYEECSTDLSLPGPEWTDLSTKVDVASLPSAPRAQREGSFDPSKVPRNPPFTAYVGNLPFDSEDADIIDIFVRNTVKEVRLLKDKETGNFKGYGYVEFHTAEGLIEALKKNEKMIRTRPIKVDVATANTSDRDRWDRDRNNDGDREPYKPYVDTTSDDWRRDSKPQEEGPPAPYEQRRGPRRYDDDKERGPRRYDDDKERGPRRYDDDKERSPRRYGSDNDTFSREEFGTKISDAPSKEPYKPRDFSREGHDDRRGPESGRDRDNPWGTNKEPSRSDGAWVRMGERAGEGAAESAPRESAPRDRPRLNLQARSGAGGATEQKSGNKPNPFGAAKPVDIQDRAAPEGRETDKKSSIPRGPAKPAANPFGSAKPTDTANWRSARAQGTGPIRTPTAQKVSVLTKDDVSSEIITDSNKFMILNAEETAD